MENNKDKIAEKWKNVSLVKDLFETNISDLFNVTIKAHANTIPTEIMDNLNNNKEEWDKNTTPKLGTSHIMQCALNWWHNLPIQNLQNMNDSWVGYLWKYYPDKTHPYHLTGQQVQLIYELEQLNMPNIKNLKDFLIDKGFIFNTTYGINHRYKKNITEFQDLYVLISHDKDEIIDIEYECLSQTSRDRYGIVSFKTIKTIKQLNHLIDALNA